MLFRSPGARARTLKEFRGLVASLPAERLTGHLRRHDFSRWIEDVFRDRPLAAHLRKLEAAVDGDHARDIVDAVAQAVRARYETPVSEDPEARLTAEGVPITQVAT